MLKRTSCLTFAALLGVAGILAACGNASTGGTSGGTAGRNFPTTAKVTIPKADRFEPFMLQIAAGGRVTFTNGDADTHTVVSMPTDPVDFTLVVASGKSVTQTFTQPGIYGYYCDAHSTYDRTTGLIRANKAADAYPISMYGMILVVGDTLPVFTGKAKIVMPSADRFDPLAMAVKKGTRVTWTNLDSDAHTVLTDPGGSVQFKFVVPANGGASYTFDTPGIYPYFCDAHALWNSELKRVQARPGSSEYPAAMEGVVFVLP
ncbi:MAG: plastocyanin/azurin family copper-binding protein [Candidatus Dormibacter sp.]